MLDEFGETACRRACEKENKTVEEEDQVMTHFM